MKKRFRRNQEDSNPKMKKTRKMNRQTRHHLIPKERVKLSTVPNDEKNRDFNRVLMLWRDKHDLWHYLFHNLTLSEIISLLQRVEKMMYK